MGISGKGWLNHCKTTVSPLYGRLFLVSKRTIFFFFGKFTVWMFPIGRARHPGPGKRLFTPGQLSVEFVNVGGGWLTCGDLALDSCAQFLAVAEHRLIPSGARSVCHQLRMAGHQSVLVSCLSGSGCWWSCWSWGGQSWWYSSFSSLIHYSFLSIRIFSGWVGLLEQLFLLVKEEWFIFLWSMGIRGAEEDADQLLRPC